MEANRHKYTIIVALDKRDPLIDIALAFGKLLTINYGGCTITNAVGFWAEDADQDKDTYGKQMVEHARKIEVVTTGDEADYIKMLFNSAIEDCKQLNDYDYSGQWIHFEHIEIECEHFQI